MSGEKRTTLSEALDERQREKLAARPMDVDFRAALALYTQKIMDIMDDKYLALSEEIAEQRRALRVREARKHGVWRRLWHALAERLTYPLRRVDYDPFDRDED